MHVTHDPLILVVDDATEVVELLRKILHKANLTQVQGFTNPVEALEWMQENAPHVVLLDIEMPEMDGLTFLRHVRNSPTTEMLPVIVMTSINVREVKLAALEAGATDFVHKPFDQLELVARVRNLSRLSTYQNMLRSSSDHLSELVKEYSQSLDESRREIIARLVRAAEFRDNETGLHVVRMSHYAMLVARSMGLPDEEVAMIYQASPMHDVGKIAIPDRVLLKPGKLNPEEWEIMKSHTTHGARILEGHSSPLMQAAAEIALYHHERWDGSGYPHGLAGESIPLHARVVMVADIFDALTSERPYKEAWATDRAVEQIRSLSGTHIDPVVVEGFFSSLPDVLTVHEKYHDPPRAVPYLAQVAGGLAQ
jgi:putative two-component system response regulator